MVLSILDWVCIWLVGFDEVEALGVLYELPQVFLSKCD